MTATPNFDALLKIVATKPERWRLLNRTPALFAFCKNVFDDRGGEWFELNAKNLRALTSDIGHALCRLDGLEWLRKDGRNVFDAPDTASVTRVAKALFVGAKNMPFGLNRLYQSLANGFMLAQWVMRQNEIIDANSWGACFMAAWVSQNGSLHLSIDLSESEAAAMFDGMGEGGGFFWNRDIKSRADLPRTIRLYRGIGSDDDPKGFLGYSWTDNPEIAAKYAVHRQRQGHGGAKIASAVFDNKDIAAVFEHYEKAGEAGGYREWLLLPSAQPQGITVKTIEPAMLIFYPELLAV